MKEVSTRRVLVLIVIVVSSDIKPENILHTYHCPLIHLIQPRRSNPHHNFPILLKAERIGHQELILGGLHNPHSSNGNKRSPSSSTS